MSFTKPQIFTLYQFRQEAGKGRCLQLHYVAGMSSAEAEATFKEEWNIDRTGEFFISTDELHSDHPRSVIMYATGYSKAEDITDADHVRWVKAMTRKSWEDGQFYPATLRKFQVL